MHSNKNWNVLPSVSTKANLSAGMRDILVAESVLKNLRRLGQEETRDFKVWTGRLAHRKEVYKRILDAMGGKR